MAEEKEIEIQSEEFFNDDLKKEVSSNLGITVKQVDTVLTMLKEGNTVPFIARYRKEQTGALDENQIREISTQYEYGLALLKRKEAVIRLIDEKGMLTDELKEKIEASRKLVEIEDLYRPFKEKKKTKATEAIALGLEPLAKELFAFPTKGTLEGIVNKYINEEKNITFESAIQGAKYIIAEWISDNAAYRKAIRFECMKNGILDTKKKKKADDPTFQMYYDYQLEIKKLKSHNILAINRGEDKDILNVSVLIDNEKTINYLNSKIIKTEESFATPLIKEAIVDSFNRLIYPSIEREVRSELTENAEDKAIEVFAVNLRNYLLAAPLKGKVMLGVDPAYRTGCKVVVVDKTGKVLEKDKIYQNQKFEGEKVPESRIREAEQIVSRLVLKYKVEVIAIGNGTASRETEEFIISVIKKYDLRNVYYSIVNEAGASVYSASKLAQDEFPDYSVEERSAVSIARRLQDPLSELVKIDPKSIGVGQYQHDVTQSKLSDSLDFVVSTAVNQVGVNVNTASKSLLNYVSGINKGIAENIIKYREENGEFKNREQIKNVPKLGPKAYEQAIGFLRLPESTEMLDATSIHPESYKLAKDLLKKLGISRLGTEETKKLVEACDVVALIKEYGKENEYTITDILDAFKAPLRDPRDELDKPLLRCEALTLEDLKIGQELQGVVRNVVDFGAFVDCGMHEDGLVHISKISKNYIKHPSEVLSVGDVVKVWVIGVDLVRHKVSLTMLKD